MISWISFLNSFHLTFSGKSSSKKKIFQVFSVLSSQALLISTIVLLFVFSGNWKTTNSFEPDTTNLIIISAVGFFVISLFLLLFYRIYAILVIETNLVFFAFIFFLFNKIQVKYDVALVLHLFGLVILGISIQLLFFKKIKHFFSQRAALWLYLQKNWKIFAQGLSNYFLIYFAPFAILLFISIYYFITGESANLFSKQLVFVSTLINISLASMIAGVIQIGFFYLIFYLSSYFFSVFLKKNLTHFYLFKKECKKLNIVNHYSNNIFLQSVKYWGRYTFMTVFVFAVFFISLLTIPQTRTFLKSIDFFSKNTDSTADLLTQSPSLEITSQTTLNYLGFIFGWIFVSFYFFILFRLPGFLFFLQNIITKLLFLFVFAVALALFENDLGQKIFPFLVIALVFDLIFLNLILFLSRKSLDSKFQSPWIKFFVFFSQRNITPQILFLLGLIFTNLSIIFFALGLSSPIVLLITFIKFCTLIFYYNIKQIVIYLKLEQWNDNLHSKIQKAYTNLPAKYQESA